MFRAGQRNVALEQLLTYHLREPVHPYTMTRHALAYWRKQARDLYHTD
jgi:hypothetical protein